MIDLEAIRQRDRQCLTYSDGTIHCSEGGDNVAQDRRTLLAEVDKQEELIQKLADLLEDALAIVWHATHDSATFDVAVAHRRYIEIKDEAHKAVTKRYTRTEKVLARTFTLDTDMLRCGFCRKAIPKADKPRVCCHEGAQEDQHTLGLTPAQPIIPASY